MSDKDKTQDQPAPTPPVEEDAAVVYRYKPADDGSYLSGVPRRHLTERDVARLRGRIADVEASPLYDKKGGKKR